MNSWTPEQDQLLSLNWSKGIAFVIKLFPSRSKGALLQRAHRLGVKTGRKIFSESIKDYLLRSFVKDEKTGCWNWIRAINHGYGVIRIEKHNKQAHRVSYSLHYGAPISDDGLQINHHCDNRRCINPDHLYVGTQKENVRDMILRGRTNYANGERNNSKLKETDIPVIRNRVANGESSCSVSKDYGVDSKVIRRIAKREKWRHVP